MKYIKSAIESNVFIRYNWKRMWLINTPVHATEIPSKTFLTKKTVDIELPKPENASLSVAFETGYTDHCPTLHFETGYTDFVPPCIFFLINLTSQLSGEHSSSFSRRSVGRISDCGPVILTSVRSEYWQVFKSRIHNSCQII